MRPLFHPASEDITVEGLLHALSDPVRSAIYREIASATAPLTCSNFLTIRDRDIPKSTLSQHFKVLREAGLIRSERHGVEMHSTARDREIDARFPGLLAAIVAAHARQQKAGRAARPAAAKPEGRARRGGTRS